MATSTTATTAKTATPPARPRLALRIGVIGHRKLVGKDGDDTRLAAVEGELASVMERVVRRAFEAMGEERRRRGCAYAAAAPLLRIVSSLADGADQVLTAAALDAEVEEGVVELDAILPFASSVYRDRTIADTTRYDALLARSARRIDLDGVYTREEGGAEGGGGEGDVAYGDPSRRARHLAYRAAAWFLLENTDLLIAVWDEARGGAAGGTEETVEKALRQGIPVVAVHPEKKDAIRVLTSAFDLTLPPASTPEWETVVSHLVAGLVASPRDVPSEYFDGTVGRGESVGRFWRWTEALLSGERARTPRQAGFADPPYGAYREPAAERAQHFADRYRSAYFQNYVLAAVAVLLASLGLMEAIDGYAWKLAFGIGELVALGIMLSNVVRAHRGRWHANEIDYRYLAELLRPMRHLQHLAIQTPLSQLPAHAEAQDPNRTWMTWLFRAVTRETGPIVPTPPRGEAFCMTTEHVRARLDAIRDQWIRGQRKYHEESARRMGRLDRRLGRLSSIAIVVVLLFTVLHVVLEILHLDGVGGLIELALVAAAFLPAAVASLLGLRSQLESARTRNRSLSMIARLDAAEEQLGALDRPEVRAQGSWAYALALPVRDLAQGMIDETADWRMLHQTHEVHAG